MEDIVRLDMEHMEEIKAMKKIVAAVMFDSDFVPLWEEAAESMDSLNRSILWSFAKLERSLLEENEIEKALFELQEDLT